MSKTLQFELWHTCLNRCKFCYLQGDQETPRMDMIRNIEEAYDIIKDEETWKEYDTVSFIGGEIFQGEMDNQIIIDRWFTLVELLVDYHKKGLIKQIYFCATLTFPKIRALWATLDYFADCYDGLWILTSYDEEGRFHTEEYKQNWLDNLNYIVKFYPKIKVNTTVICTGAVCQKYLENPNYFKELEDLGTSLFLKVPSRPKLYKTNKEANEKMKLNFFPTRELFLEFITELGNNRPDLLDKMCNINLRADTLIGKWKNQSFTSNRDKSTYMEEFDKETEFVMKCGHISTYNAYLNEDGCALCDIEIIKGQLNG